MIDRDRLLNIANHCIDQDPWTLLAHTAELARYIRDRVGTSKTAIDPIIAKAIAEETGLTSANLGQLGALALRLLEEDR